MSAVKDPRVGRGLLGKRVSPLGPHSFILMQFSAIFCQIIVWRTPHWGSWKSWIATGQCGSGKAFSVNLPHHLLISGYDVLILLQILLPTDSEPGLI